MSLSFPYELSLPLLRLLSPETAHRITIRALSSGIFPQQQPKINIRLKANLFGLEFSSPLGLAAGFDKDGEVFDQMLNFGFGFVEVGTITPKPQVGNSPPRVFRLTADNGIINRLGFNNKGIESAVVQLSKRVRSRGLVAVNVGPNRNSEDFISDYETCINKIAKFSDLIVLNISSPNTPGLRELQDRRFVEKILDTAINTLEKINVSSPILIKIAPDLDTGEIESIVDAAIQGGAKGIIVGNTSVSRPPGLKSRYKNKQGGLSGQPIFTLATKALSDAFRVSRGRIVLVGTGGVFSGEDAYSKICAGANLVELYTALVYQGPSLIKKINEDLVNFLDRDGYKNITEAVGTRVNL